MPALRLAKACLDICRVSNLPTIWTNVLTAQLLATGQFVPWDYLLLLLALSFFYMAGMALNDLCDAESDRLTKPQRPIPSGRISRQGAKNLIYGLFATGFLLLSIVPFPRAEIAALLLLATIIAYDLNHKGTPASVFIMAACRLLVFAVTSLALTGKLVPTAMLAGGIQFAYVVVISLVARQESRRPAPFPLPIIPIMLACISLLDGIILALLTDPAWLAAGFGGALLTWGGQSFVRGD